jgi:hypothetical protein
VVCLTAKVAKYSVLQKQGVLKKNFCVLTSPFKSRKVSPMRFPQQMRFVTALLLLTAVVVSSCTTINEKSGSGTTIALNSGKKFVLIRPKIKMYELSVGGLNTEKEEWTKSANDNAVDAIRKQLIGMGKEVVVVDSDEYKEETGELLGIYETVQTNIQRHVFGAEYNKFPAKAADFKFWSGDTKALLKRFEADYVLAVYGYGQIESAGRKATQAAGMIVGAFFGRVVVMSGGYSMMSVGMLDKDGMIAWFGQNTPVESADFRDAKEVSSMVKKMFEKSAKPKKK